MSVCVTVSVRVCVRVCVCVSECLALCCAAARGSEAASGERARLSGFCDTDCLSHCSCCAHL